MLKHQVIVVGGGLAGLRAAVETAQAGEYGRMQRRFTGETCV